MNPRTLALGAIAGALSGFLIAQLPWPWSAVVILLIVVLSAIWLIRLHRQVRRAQRYLAEWLAYTDERGRDEPDA
jgi:MFS family permease